MKYYKYLVVIASIGVIVSSFMPWTYYPDIDDTFTGFYSKDNLLGNPGYILCFFAVTSIIAAFVNKTIVKHVGLGLAAVNIAYVIKVYVSYTGCYLGTCPVKLTGIYLLILFSVVLLIAALFPDLKVKADSEEEQEG